MVANNEGSRNQPRTPREPREPSRARRESREAAHAAIDGSRLEIMEGMGHFPHVEDPERFAVVLLDFITSTVAGPIGSEGLRDVILGNDDKR